MTDNSIHQEGTVFAHHFHADPDGPQDVCVKCFLPVHPAAKEEVCSVNPITGGKKGVKQARYGLIPTYPLEMVARLYGYGAKKYADRNWEQGYEWSKSYDALQRHLNAFWSGQDLDEESGLPHLASAVFHCFALMEWGRTRKELDDRPKKER